MNKNEAITLLKKHLIENGSDADKLSDSDFTICKEERKSNFITSFYIRYTLKIPEKTPIGQTLDHIVYYVDDTGRCLPLPV